MRYNSMLYAASRRRFVQTAANVIAAIWGAGDLRAQRGKSRTAGSSGTATRFWIDPRMSELLPTPWRKVDIEFHNSRHIPRVGERFNADEFGNRLLEAHVNGAVVWAKDMFG